jgi:prophage regulatory protein
MSNIIRRAGVEQKTGLSYETINRYEKRGEFPARVQLGTNSVGWFEDEVDDWIKARVRAFGRRVGVPAT